MKNTELRIGNIINVKLCDGQITESVVNSLINGCAFCRLGWEVDSLIPLTKEWLLKLGFIKTITGFRIKGVFMEKNGKGFDLGLTTDNSGIIKLQWIHSVHQLQNIYFALTGEELEIKETS